jgi:hypothetical protein
MKASDFLRQAAEVIEQRGQLRDKPDGERSMERAVDAYVTLNGPVMQTETQGWIFMCILKLARATAGKPHTDDAIDLSGYAALLAECIEKGAAGAPDEEESNRAVEALMRRQAPWDDSEPVYENYFDILEGKPIKPNATTEQAIAEARAGVGEKHESADALFNKLDEWIPWQGPFYSQVDLSRYLGPVHAKYREVTVRLRNGTKETGPAQDWGWEQGCHGSDEPNEYDIVAYKILNKEVE